MTVPGLGGQQPPPQNASPAGQLVPGITPGISKAIVLANTVVVFGPTGANVGVFVYTPGTTPAAGNAPIFWATNQTTDPYGNAVTPTAGVQGTGQFTAGNTVINASGIFVYSGPSATLPVAELSTGTLSFTAAGGQNSPGVVGTFGTAGEIGLTSGLVTGADNPANIIVDSAAASGVSATSIFLQAAQTTLNLTATTVTPSPNVNPGHQSAAPAAYSQSYEQASTNRINQILDVLVQTGVWHT